MADYSDPGYEYLGRHLASRGLVLISVDNTVPMEIAGTQTKAATSTVLIGLNVGMTTIRGYHMTTMANSDSSQVSFRGRGRMKAGASLGEEGTWQFATGRGKLRGITGKGTYKRMPAGDGSSSCAVEGEYEIKK